MICSLTLQLVYWPVPKAASTAVKFAMARAAGIDVSGWTVQGIHDRYPDDQHIEIDTGVGNAGYHGLRSLTVLRDPIDRLWSAYRDKVVRPRIGPPREQDRHRLVPAFLYDADFPEFVCYCCEQVTDEPPATVNIHWRRQVDLVPLPCDVVATVADLSPLQALGLDVRRANVCDVTDPMPALSPCVDRLIRTTYEADFEAVRNRTR